MAHFRRHISSAVILASALVLGAGCGGDPARTDGSAGGNGSSTASGGDGGCGLRLQEVLAEDESLPTAIVADESHVYWLRTGRRQLVRVAVDGGPVEMLAEHVEGYDLAIDDRNVYVSLTHTGVAAVPKEGGAPVSLTTSLSVFDKVHGIAAYDGKLAWASDGALYLHQDGVTTQLTARVDDLIGYRNVAMDAGGIYDATTPDVVRRYGFDGVPLRAVPMPPGDSLRLSGELVVVAHGQGPDAGLSIMPKQGGALTRITTGEDVTPIDVEISPTEINAIDVAVDGDELYVLTTLGVEHGVVGGTSLEAMQLEFSYSELSPGGENNAIAINSTHVFWTAMGDRGNPHNGQISRLPRCP